jgi:Fibronectin type III domain
VEVCALKTWKLQAWTCALAIFVSLLTGCNDPTGTSATTAQSAASSGTSSGSSSGSGNASATLSWEAPTTNTNGSPLTNLAGYRIYYGTSATDLSQNVQLNGVGVQTYVFDNLQAGTWYFAVMAVTSAGVESALSNRVSATIM